MTQAYRTQPYRTQAYRTQPYRIQPYKTQLYTIGQSNNYVTLPPKMSHIATRSLFGYSHFPKAGAMYRCWLFNGVSLSSLFYVRQIHWLHTQHV